MSNLKDQVLSIKQVQELIELGFDVSKYASMCWLKEPNGDKLLITTLDESCYEAACMNPVPTLTIGDIIKVLPVMIGVYSIDFDFIGNQVYVDYIYKGESLLKLDHIFYMDNKESAMSNLMNALFNTLKWCIVKKRISKK